MTSQNRKERSITVILPAFNEEGTIGNIVQKVRKYVDDVIVVNDGSKDKTAENALKHGATVISHRANKGYIHALRTGLKYAEGEVIVIMDADGQHEPDDIPRLVKPILDDEADLVIGARERLSSFSEKILTILTRAKVNTQDASSGFKAITKDVAKKMNVKGECVCGTFVLEAFKLGARVVDIKIKTKPRAYGKSRMKGNHLIQFFLVLKELFF